MGFDDANRWSLRLPLVLAVSIFESGYLMFLWSKRPRRCRFRRKEVRLAYGPEPLALEWLEGRQLMAADLAVTLTDAHAYVLQNTQVEYTLTVQNLGDAIATAATLTNSFSSSTSGASAITSSTWTAAYSGTASSGPLLGSGNINNKITLAPGATATFTIVATVSDSAVGTLKNTATATFLTDPNSVNNTASDTDIVVPRSIAVSQAAGALGSSLIQLVSPTTGVALAQAYAFEPSYKAGVQVVMADLNDDGKNEIVCAPSYGRVAEVVVFSQIVSSTGSVTLQKLPGFTFQPFGSSYRKGLSLAVGDVNGDKKADLAVSQTSGKGAVVIHLSTGSSWEATAYRSFIPFATAGFSSGYNGGSGVFLTDLGTFSSGATVSSSVLDGRCELGVTSGPTASPRIEIYDPSTRAMTLIDTVQPLNQSLRGGFSVVTARVDNDLISDFIVSEGRGGTSRVEIYNGIVDSSKNNPVLSRFAAFSDLATRSAPVFAAAIDTTGDGVADSIDVVQGGASRASLRRYLAIAGTLQQTVAPLSGSLHIAVPVSRITSPQDVPPGAVFIETASGLKYRDVFVGTGASPASSSATVTVNYEGWLLNGTRFDGNNGTQFALSGVIAGWTEGVASMKVGGIRQLIIKPSLAYGATARTGIPANSTLVFTIKLISTP